MEASIDEAKLAGSAAAGLVTLQIFAVSELG
jgi:hypothetical protein